MPSVRVRTDELQFIRAIKGAPATILLLLMMRGAAMTNAEIGRWTGYSDKPVAGALAVLEQMRLIQFNGRANGWSLIGGNQVVLPFADQSGGLQQQALTRSAPRAAGALIADSPPPSCKELSTGSAEVGIFPTSPAGSRKNSDFRAGSAAADLDLRSSLLEISDQQQQRAGSRKFSDLDLLVIHSGVREPARSLVLASAPAAVLAWWWESQLAAADLASPLGWFIRRLQLAAVPPADLVAIATVWLALPAALRRELAQADYGDAEAIWFAHGLGPTSAELAWDVARAGGLDYAEW